MSNLPTITADPHFFYLTLPGRTPVRIPTHRGDVLARILASRQSAIDRARIEGGKPNIGIGTIASPTQYMIEAFCAKLGSKPAQSPKPRTPRERAIAEYMTDREALALIDDLELEI